MSLKKLFKTVFATAVLVLLILMSMHNRATVDFSLLPLANRSFQGPVALMYIAFFALGVLMGMVICIRGGRKQTPPSSTGTAPAPRIQVADPRIGATAEPRIGSRIS